MSRRIACCALIFAACGSSHTLDAGADSGAPARDGGRDAASHRCVGMPDGAACGSERICLHEACVESVCGDGFVDEARESCDDGNDVAFDGCDPSCLASDCSFESCGDGQACNGAEGCDPTMSACVAGEPLDDGAACHRTDPAGADGVCRAGHCVTPGCGNGVVEETEHCDDGNTDDSDGCNNDCTAPD